MNLDRSLRQRLAPVATRVAQPLRRVHPVTLTVTAGLLGIGGSLFIAGGLPIGAALAVVGVLLDAVDGPVARLTGRESRFGAWLDSTVDRAVDFTLTVALAYRGHALGDERLLIAGLAAALGSFLASYARARAEGLEVYTTEGIAPRWVRLIFVAAAGLALAAGEAGLAGLLLALVAVAGLSTAIARGLAVFSEERSS